MPVPLFSGVKGAGTGSFALGPGRDSGGRFGAERVDLPPIWAIWNP